MPVSPSAPGELSAVSLSLGEPGSEAVSLLRRVEAEAERASGVRLALDVAGEVGARLPLPGGGRTRDLWECLASLGAHDLTLARALEPHLDAAAILAEAGAGPMPEASVWGVYAAEGPGARLEATQQPGSSVVLDGVKPWCSLADRVSHALVTAWVGDERGLFAVDLRQDPVVALDEEWVAAGLPTITSGAVRFTRASATAVGEAGWYLERDGFAWGGMGVAAVWYGGAVGVARRMVRQARERDLDQVGQAHLGAVDAALHAARAVLAEAAGALDEGRAHGGAGADLALRVRQVVHDAAEEVLRRADHALGPAPLAREADHAARTADLHLYLRQHHGERDAAALGRRVALAPTW